MKHFTYSSITLDGDFTFQITLFTLQVDQFEVHTHDFSELVIILGGTARHLMNGHLYPIMAGDVFVLNGDMEHGFEACQGLQLCNIMYNPEQMLNVRQDVYQLAGYYALFVVEPLYRTRHPLHNQLRLAPMRLASIRAQLDKMLHEYTSRPPAYMTMLQAYFVQLVIELSRDYSAREPDKMYSDTTLELANAIMLMERGYQQPLTLHDLATAAHMSQSHFLRVFKETFGLPPIQYLIRIRITHACHLLINTPKPITEVAHDVGFDDGNYFSRQFKQVMGDSPQVYRRQNRR